MKMKPRVVSKKAASGVWINLEGASSKDGAQSRTPLTVTGVGGIAELTPESTIATVYPRYLRFYKAGSGKPSSRTFTFIDGAKSWRPEDGERGNTASLSRAGGALILHGAFTPSKIGIKGTIRQGFVSGYVTTSTGRFADAGVVPGKQFSARLTNEGTQWELWIPS
jgi:hypothetical protein